MSTVKIIAMQLLNRDLPGLRGGHLYVYAGGAGGLSMR
jgi:hypothetical protein